jgi:hypothetical protein
MEKEFLDYTEALALKELGFDEPCFKGYTEEYKTLISFSNTHTNTSVKNTLPTKPFTAPLYQQAFRWFREKYDLWNCIQKYASSDSPTRCYYELKGDNINTDKDESPNSYMSGWFNSYKEAELACVKKLIEIVKEKKKVVWNKMKQINLMSKL